MTEPVPDVTPAPIEADEHGVVHVDTSPDAEVPNALDTSPDAADDDDTSPQTLEQARKLRSENRSLRTRLRTAEADVERLATQAAAWQHREIERTAAEVLVDPADVWRVDPELQQSFYDDRFGEISTDGVIAAAEQLAQSKPHLAKPTNSPPPTDRPIEGLRGGASPEPKRAEVTWSSALRRAGI